VNEKETGIRAGRYFVEFGGSLIEHLERGDRVDVRGAAGAQRC